MSDWNCDGEPQQFEDNQIKQDDGSWVDGVYLCRHDGAAIVATQRPDDGFNYFWSYWAHIRPIRSAEKVAVEAMLVTEDGVDQRGFNTQTVSPGLSKREHLAAMAMQGILSGVNGDASLHHDSKEWKQDVVESSVEFADALLAELERTK